jgi:hypothetical protein
MGKRKILHPGVMWLATAVYLGIALWGWRIHPPQEFGDTYRYFGSTIFDIQNPGITPVWLYTTLQDPWLVTLTQTLLSALTWLLLAWVIYQRIASSTLRIALPLLTLAVSLTPAIWSWNAYLSSESLSFSTAVAWIAAISYSATPATRPWLATAAVLGTGSAFIITRPAVLVIVLPVSVLIAWWQIRTTRSLAPAVTTIGGTAVVSVYGLVRLMLLSSDPIYRYRYAINNYVDKTSSFRAHVDEQMPACEPLVAAVNGPAPWDEVWVLKEQLMSVCTDSYLWLQSSQTAASSWVPAIPFDAVLNFFGSMRSVILAPYGPARVMSDVAEVLLPLTTPWWILALSSVVLGLLIVAVAGLRPRSWSFAVTSSFLVLASLAVYCFAVWAADGIELARHLLPVTALFPIVAVVMPTVLLSQTLNTPATTPSVNPLQVGR